MGRGREGPSIPTNKLPSSHAIGTAPVETSKEGGKRGKRGERRSRDWRISADWKAKDQVTYTIVIFNVIILSLKYVVVDDLISFINMVLYSNSINPSLKFKSPAKYRGPPKGLEISAKYRARGGRGALFFGGGGLR